MRHSVRLGFIAILCVCSASAAHAIPQLINFQGILTDGLSNPITTTTSVQFRIWDMSAGGTELWMETQSITPDGNGQFSVLLGSSVPIPDSALAAVAAFLGITISPDPETSPRTQLVAVAYAFRPGTVDGASGGNITSKVSIGPGHSNTGGNAFVAGASNTASDDNATVSGGKNNMASGFAASVGGGRQNVASNTDAAVGGGLSNDATGLASVVSGGETNTASDSHNTIGGGHNNVASGSHTTISGGQNNTAEGDRATVGGGQWNWARGDYSVVAGGGGAATADSNSAIGFRSAVVGGNGNVASGQNSFVGGGKDNQSTGAWAAITAGSNNQATETSATVGGGGGNQATGLESTVSGGSVNGALAEEATVAGGAANMATGIGSAIGGGANNVAGGNRATVPGGRACEANGDHSFAAGRLAFAQHDGCFVWGDDRGIPANSFSTGPNQFIIFAEGGVGIETELPFNPTTTSTRLTMNGSIGFKNGTTGMLYVYESGSANAPRPVISHSPQFENWGLTWVDDGDKMVFQRGGSPVMSVDLGAFNVGIRVQDPTNILQVVQSSPTDPIADAWTVYSSRRWKKNIQTMDGALDKMLQLRGVTYDWKETGKSDIGLIAEEVGEVFPEIVAYEDNGIDAKSVDYARLVAVLIEANREQQAQLDQQRGLIEQLAQRVQMIERP